MNRIFIFQDDLIVSFSNIIIFFSVFCLPTLDLRLLYLVWNNPIVQYLVTFISFFFVKNVTRPLCVKSYSNSLAPTNCSNKIFICIKKSFWILLLLWNHRQGFHIGIRLRPILELFNNKVNFIALKKKGNKLGDFPLLICQEYAIKLKYFFENCQNILGLAFLLFSIHQQFINGNILGEGNGCIFWYENPINYVLL